MDTVKKVGERIRYFRKLKNWSQEVLAFNAELNPAFIGHIERGLKSPTITTLEKITGALEISLAELFADGSDNDDETIRKESAIEKIVYAVRDLPTEDIEKIANIVLNIVELRTDR